MRALSSILIFLLMLGTAAAAQDRPGLGVDRMGNPVVDPTENVKALNEAAQKRQDDLRAADSSLNEVRYGSLREMVALRAEYEDRLRRAEASRLDAIRLVDTNNVAVANERAVATATALAKTVNDSAQVLSAQVVKSADDVRKATAEQFAALTARISALEQGSAEGIGKQKFQDPAQTALIEEVRKLSRLQSDTAGAGVGRGEILGGLAVILTLLIATYVALRPAARR